MAAVVDDLEVEPTLVALRVCVDPQVKVVLIFTNPKG